jgi:hypothetical protein
MEHFKLAVRRILLPILPVPFDLLSKAAEQISGHNKFASVQFVLPVAISQKAERHVKN